MSSTEVLQDYLIKLGYQTDLSSLRRFDENLTGTSKKIYNVGTKTAAVIATVGAATVAFAYSMRKTFYAADVANSSAKSMNALGFAAKQAGLDAGVMESAVIALANAMRYDPGKSAYIELLIGTSTKGKEATEVLELLRKSMAKMDPFVAKQIMADVAGMSEETFFLWQKNGDAMEKNQARIKALYDQAGINAEKLRADVEATTEAFDVLGERAELSAQRIMSALLPTTKSFAKDLGDTAEWYANLFEGKTNASWGKVFKLIATPGSEIAKLFQSEESIRERELASLLPPEVRARASVLQRSGSGVIGAPSAQAAAPGHAPSAPAAPGYTPVAGARAPRGIRNNNPMNLQFAGQPGATKEAGPGGRFAVFGTMAEGLAAMQRQIALDMSRGVTVRQLMNKYAPSFENDTAAYINRISKATGVAPDAKLAAGNQDQLRAIMRTMIATENGAQYVDQLLGGTRLGVAGGGGVTINANTTIQVNGTSDPENTASAVARRQANVNKDLARNAGSVMQ